MLRVALKLSTMGKQEKATYPLRNPDYHVPPIKEEEEEELIEEIKDV